MTDKKISELPEITTPASADIIPVVDIDANTTKKITAANLTTFVNNAFPAETIRDTIGAMLTGNTETDIAVTHDDSNDKINFVVSVSASNLPNNIDAAKIGDGSVSNAEFQRLDGLTADIQTQIDTKVNKSGDTMSGTLAMGNNAITTSSTVDGRDVSTDGTKLDGIEAGATADQTNTEIRAAVEAASDSNVFTDADHTKLNGIEASATADQTNAEIRTAVEAASDSNVFTDADHTKLNGIEASADVTDATNVTAAGALMDSELTNVAAVKGINQALTTTSSPTFAGITGPLTGNASTASTLATARTINLGGEVTGSASFDGSQDITITGTIAANSVGINELALNDGSNGQFIQTDGAGTITFASAIGSSVINNAAANRITTVNANTNDFDAESNLTFDGSTLALTGNMTASGTIDGVDISARDAVLTSTTTTANAALPKSGGAMTGAITSASDFTIDAAGDIILDVGGGDIKLTNAGSNVGEINVNSNGGDIQLANKTQDKDITFHCNDGGSMITALQLDGSEAGKANFNAGALFGSHINLNDNTKLKLGDSDDLEIYHNGVDSIIKDATGGNLIVQADDFKIMNAAGTENILFAQEDGLVRLFYNNSTKLETASGGIDVTGSITADGLTIDGGTNRQYINNGHLRLSDGYNLEWGGGTNVIQGSNASNHVLIKTNGSEAVRIDSSGRVGIGTTSPTNALSVEKSITGDFVAEFKQGHSNAGNSYGVKIEGGTNASDTAFLVANQGGTNMFEIQGDGKVGIGNTSPSEILSVTGNIAVSGTVDGRDIATDGTKLDGIATGATNVTNNNQLTNGAGYIGASGGTLTGDLKYNDSVQAKFGDSEDLKIYHDGNHSYIRDSGTGDLMIRGTEVRIKSNVDNDDMITCIENGAVNLFYSNTNMASTVANGFRIQADKRLEIGNGTNWSGEQAGKIENHSDSMYHQYTNNFITRNPSGTNTLTIDSSGNGTFNANVTAYSDIRLKEDVKTIDNALDKVLKLRGVEYTRKETKAKEIGVIAQEVKEIVPELVRVENTKSDINPEGFEDLHTMKYGNTVALLIEAIKELKAEIEILKKDK